MCILVFHSFCNKFIMFFVKHNKLICVISLYVQFTIDCQIHCLQVFSPDLWVFFHSVSFVVQKLFSLLYFYMYFCFCCCAFGWPYPRKHYIDYSQCFLFYGFYIFLLVPWDLEYRRICICKFMCVYRYVLAKF
jgi:hypothetical protein